MSLPDLVVAGELIDRGSLKRSLKHFLSIPRDDILRAFEVLDMLRKDLE